MRSNNSSTAIVALIVILVLAIGAYLLFFNNPGPTNTVVPPGDVNVDVQNPPPADVNVDVTVPDQTAPEGDTEPMEEPAG